MKRTAAGVAATLGAGLAAACAEQHPPPLAIEHVTVVDVVHGTLRPDQNVILHVRYIEALGPAATVPVPPDAERVDGTGKFLMPGLWDMHVHLNPGARDTLVAWGVTGARVMGGSADELLAWRREDILDPRRGPRLVVAGPALRGPEGAAGGTGMWTIASPADAVRAVDSLAMLGVDFVKVWEGLSREAYFAALRAARARGLMVVGHVPATVTPIEASDSGLASIEHLEFLPDPCLVLFDRAARAARRAPPRGCDPGALDTLLRRLVRNRTWLDPTIGSFRTWVGRERFPALLAGFRDVVPLMRRSGVRLLVGTDIGSFGMVPGAALHDELALLVDAGYTAAEVLRAATLNPARFLRIDDLHGSIAVGKRADLLLLEGDPLADIRNTRRIAAVFRERRFLGRAQLDRLRHPAAATPD